MIIIMIGGIGSGKTVSCIKEIISSGNFAYTNFSLKGYKRYKRLKFSDVLLSDDKGKFEAMNWEYWDGVRKKAGDFSIYFDEMQEIIHSRNSMSRQNILLSKWISQVRKILSDSPKNHIYLITQRINAIDIHYRELAQVIIVCHKFVIRGCVYIKQYYYEGIINYELGRYKAKSMFYANPYFRFYDSYDMVRFSDSGVYL